MIQSGSELMMKLLLIDEIGTLVDITRSCNIAHLSSVAEESDEQFGVLYPGNIIITIIDNNSHTNNIMSSTSSGSVSSRRKQAKPQRLSHESDLCPDSTVTNDADQISFMSF
uniref:Uncharacterized protein n=1 Tax=Onchocerca volvulus TaxID=6282 RepID=A0A8R1TZ92_ONCVO